MELLIAILPWLSPAYVVENWPMLAAFVLVFAIGFGCGNVWHRRMLRTNPARLAAFVEMANTLKPLEDAAKQVIKR